MPLTQVQRVASGSAANVASQTATYGSTPAQNNLLVALANSDATLTMTSTGWTLAVSQINNTGLYQWYKLAGASEPTTVTVTPSVSASTELIIFEFSGNAIVAVLDRTASSTGASTGTTAATTQADELAIAAEGVSANASLPTCTWTNSFVASTSVQGLGSTSTALNPATRALVATGTVVSVPTTSFGVASGALVATYKAASVAAAPKQLAALGVG